MLPGEGSGCECSFILDVTRQDTSAVNVYEVEVLAADVTQDNITVRLQPNSAAGMLMLQLTGTSPDHTIREVQRPGGTHHETFDIPNLPEGNEFTQVKATWSIDGVAGSTTRNFATGQRFRVLGKYLITQYNTPKEGDCSGAPQASCVSDVQCSYTGVNMKSEFVAETFENGHGRSDDNGDLEWGDWCWNNGFPRPETCAFGETFGPDLDGVIGSCGTTLEPDAYVARNPQHPDLACNDQVFIHNVGTRTVADSCDACTTNNFHHLDHYAGVAGCNDVPTLGTNLMTLKLF